MTHSGDVDLTSHRRKVAKSRNLSRKRILRRAPTTLILVAGAKAMPTLDLQISMSYGATSIVNSAACLVATSRQGAAVTLEAMVLAVDFNLI